MNCTESLDLLNQRLDGDPLADRAALEQHLRSCRDCRELHAAAGGLEEGLRLFPMPRPRPGLSDAIVAGVLADRRARIRQRRGWVAALAVAAALLVAVFLGAGGWQTHEQTARVSDGFKVAAPAESTISVRESVSEVGSALASLTQRTANEAVGQSRLLLPEVLPAPPLTESPMVQLELDPTTASLKQAGQGVATALDPVTTSARRAFGMLLREPATSQNQ